MRRLRLVAFAPIILSVSCMTLVKDPGQERVAHPITLGIPGILVNPGSAIGLLANADMPASSTEHVVSGGRGASAFSILPKDADDDARAISQSDMSLRASILHFPSKQSFFFWGVTSRYGESRAAYSEHTLGYQITDQDEGAKTASVEWVDRYGTVGATLGTSLISILDNHFFTSVVGISAEKQVFGNRSFVNDGSRHAVDEAQRDSTLLAYDDVRKRIQFHYYFMSGMSF